MAIRCGILLLALILSLSAIPFCASATECYRSVPTERKQIALTFDDGPHPRLTPRILEILDRYGVRATFFMIGKNVTDYPSAARMVAESGHEIGNHTASHIRLDRVGADRARSELTQCADAIEAVCGARPTLFRPPEGGTDAELLGVCGEEDYRVILWSVDTRDWESKNAQVIASRVLSDACPGDIILLHDFIGTNSRTPEALELIIPALLAKGYEFVTVSELIGADAQKAKEGN